MQLVTVGAARRWFAVASSAVALLALAAQPALAAGGYVQSSRSIALTGERDELRMDTRLLDAAPGSGAAMQVGFGPEGTAASFKVKLHADGTNKASRRVVAEGYGQFKGVVTGEACEWYGHDEYGYSSLLCSLEDYDWATDRYYSLRIKRGGQNSNGWLWTIKLHDMLNPREPITLTSFRLPYGQLSPNFNFVFAYSQIADCSTVDRVQAHARKPSGEGSTATWGPPDAFRNGCAGSTLKAPLDSNGDLKLIIAQ